MLDIRNTVREICNRRPRIVVLPIGAVEQHGGHLPVGTDWIIAEEIALRVAKELDAFLLPGLPFSMSQCHGPSPGTVWLTPLTLAAVVEDLVTALYKQGLRTIVIINGHGGNFILPDIVEDLCDRYKGLELILLPEFPELVEYFFSAEAAKSDIHAGEVETSIQLFLNKDYVVLEEMQDFVPAAGREYLDYVFLPDLSPSGVWGRPSKSNPDKGRDYLEAYVNACVRYVRDTLHSQAAQKRRK